ncbi:hypothetical protein [Rhizobium mongolense]|nr:hypothetical protein [Rhizobium mongolense]
MQRDSTGMALVEASLDCASQTALAATFRNLTDKTPGDARRRIR